MSSRPNTAFIVLFVVAAALSCPFLTCTGWFFYDGVVTYPKQQQMWQSYSRIYQEYTDPNEAGRKWKKLAAQKDWPATKPTQRTEKDILTQYILGGVCSFFSLTAGIAALVFGLLLWRDKNKSPT